ncbi:MAG: zinc-binding dehydrogenase, partial [Acidobacteria bacterium]|nr:zinc-binding dehydrogenase [Acidobacteriota bacterium]
SRYFEALASFPFIPGHEVVAQRADGSRVVLEPVLGPETRGEVPAWPGAGQADGNDYGHLTAGLLEPGLQTGSCASTGGGWSQMFAAHDSQLHVVDENLSDESAVMIEPTAAGIHAVLRGNVPDGGTVAVIGAGTMGLTAIAALRRYTKVDAVVVAARYPHQHQAARLLGADLTVVPDELGRAIRRAAGTRVVGSTLGSGVDVTIDAVGSSSSLTDAIGFTRPRGRVVLLGMPNQVDMNLTALWHRETELVGAYCYGTEHGHGDRHTFELAADMVGDLDLGQLVSEVFPLAEYQTAIEHAAQAGPRGLIKIAFDLREDAA